MKRIPIFFDGEISAEEVRRIFEQAGYHVRSVDGDLVAQRVPAFLLRDGPPPQAKPVIQRMAAPVVQLRRPGIRRA